MIPPQKQILLHLGPRRDDDGKTNVVGHNNPVPWSANVANTPSQTFKEIRNVSEEKL